MDGLPESAIGRGDPLTPEGRDKLFESKGPSVIMSTDDPAFVGHTSDPKFNPPNRVAGADDDVVFSEAERCVEHPDCMVVTTQLAVPLSPEAPSAARGLGLPSWQLPEAPSRTHDPGYETPSRTVDAAPLTPTITPEWPEPGWGTAMDEARQARSPGSGGPFWDASRDVADWDEAGLLRRPYAIIEDMGSLFRELYDDVMEATYRLRSGALKYLCRAIALVFGVVLFGLLIVGGVGVVLVVWLLKASAKAESIYWADRTIRSSRYVSTTGKETNR